MLNQTALRFRVFTVRTHKICYSFRLFCNLRRFCRLMLVEIKLGQRFSVKGEEKD
jgi:hypothetical protein